MVEYSESIYRKRKLLLARAKLTSTTHTSAFLTGFSMVSFLEVHLRGDLSQEVLLIYSIITTSVTTINLLALLISTCVLPHLDAACEMKKKIKPHDKPHEHYYFFTRMAWYLSAGVGIIMFLVQMFILAWVRYSKTQQMALYASVSIIVPFFVIFLIFIYRLSYELMDVRREGGDDTSFSGIIDSRHSMRRPLLRNNQNNLIYNDYNQNVFTEGLESEKQLEETKNENKLWAKLFKNEKDTVIDM